MPGRVARLLAGLAVVVSTTIAGAGTAVADPARPTDQRSEILAVDPEVDGVTIDVLGGDAFLRVVAESGHTVAVPGYSGEPWLRIDADGRVERNKWSAATYINEARDGVATVPDRAGEDTEPEWEVVATDGSWAWHDHRIHYMGSGEPAVTELDDGTRWVQEWTIPLTVDGIEVEVRGRLVALPASVPIVPVGLAVLAAAAALVAGRRRPRVVGTVAALGAGVLAMVVGFGEWSFQPPGTGASALVVALPALGVLAALAGVVLTRRGAAAAAMIATLAAVALLVGWALVRVAVLWHPELPTVLPAVADRTGVAVVLALGAVAGYLATARRPAGPEQA